MNSKLKFGLITIIIIGTLTWLGVSGVNETATYYVTVDELRSMDDALEKRLRVGGDVEPNSIVRNSEKVVFTITQGDEQLKVVYTGSDPLPDTFRDRAQALCDGRLRSDGVFEAKLVHRHIVGGRFVDTRSSRPKDNNQRANLASRRY